MELFILHHRDDLGWVRQHHGANAHVIAHEDYLPLLVGEVMPCFFDYSRNVEFADDAIKFLSFNWHRDKKGRDLCAIDQVSIAEAFSAGLWITVAGMCREYFALKHWCEHYECVYVSCNEPPKFLEVAKKFRHHVQIYDPVHRQTSLLRSFSERVLDVQPILWRGNLLRKLQTPFLKWLRNKTLNLGDWTATHFAARQSGWISVNSRQPWKGAYSRKVPHKFFFDAERLVPENFHAMFAPPHLNEVLCRIDVSWDDELIELLSWVMTDRYRQYRAYFVSVLALYLDMFASYRPAELVIASGFYEPYLVAAQLARARSIKISLLVDGYPIVAFPTSITKVVSGTSMFDRIYATGCQHQRLLLKDKPETLEIVAISPPILDMHNVHGKVDKCFDAIIMTWIPNDLRLDGRYGSRPNTLLDAIKVAFDSGLEKLAIKIKHHAEKEWLIPVLEQAGYLNKVTILEGRFSDHVVYAHKVIGGISSSVGESAYHGIPYYIYEPIINGYSEEQIASAVVIAKDGVARSPAELYELLKRSSGSVVDDKALLFGTECL